VVVVVEWMTFSAKCLEWEDAAVVNHKVQKRASQLCIHSKLLLKKSTVVNRQKLRSIVSVFAESAKERVAKMVQFKNVARAEVVDRLLKWCSLAQVCTVNHKDLVMIVVELEK